MISTRATHQVTNQDFIVNTFRKLKPEESLWVASLPGDPTTADRRLWGGRAAPPIPAFIQPNQNNYVAVSSFKRGEDGLYHRRINNFGHMHLVMIDDVGTKVRKKKLVLKPSAMVETSPGNYQAWYILEPPEPDRHKADRLVKGMIEAGLTADATDPGMRGVTRYGRLPVGINGKEKYVKALGAPFVQRVTIWAPELTYSIEEIADAFCVDLTQLAPAKRKNKPRHKPVNSTSSSGEDETLSMLSQAGLYLGEHDGMSGVHRIVCPWVSEHTDEEPSGTAFFEPSEANGWSGGFKCHHGHCQERTISHLRSFLRQLMTLSKGI
jgi:hypothetical protein